AVGRQAPSSASCAANYSPSRASARPRSRSVETDLDLSALDLHLVGLSLDRVVEVVLARLRVVLPAVPGAGEVVVRVEHAVPERALQMEAVTLERVELAVEVDERDFDLARGDRVHGSRLDVVGLCDRHEIHA